MAVYNLFSGDSQKFIETAGDWTSSDAIGVIGGNRRKYSLNGSLRITPDSTDQVSLNSPLVVAPDDWDNLTLRGFGWFYCSVNTLVRPIIQIDSGLSAIETVGAQFSVIANKWVLVDIEAPYIHSELAQIRLLFEIDGHAGNEILFTYPVLTNSDLPARNQFARQVYGRMPEYLTQADKDQESPNFPLYRFLDVCSYGLGELVSLWTAFRAVPADEATEENPEKSSALVDPLLADVRYLPWLAGLLGFRLRNPSTGVSDWQGIQGTLADWLALQTDVDTTTVDTYDSPEFSAMSRNGSGTTVTATIGNPHAVQVGDWINISGVTPSSFNGDFEVTGITNSTVTWSQTGTASESASGFGTLTLYDTDWGELEAFVVAVTNAADYLRKQVQYSFFGLGAGKNSTLKEIAKTTLEADEEPQVKIVSFFGGDEWHIRVYAVDSELISGADPTASLQASAPAGYEVSFQAVSQATFDAL